MKILHLIYTNGIAGAEKYLYHLLPGLKQHGFDCHLVVVSSGRSSANLAEFFKGLEKKDIQVKFIHSGKAGFPVAAFRVYRYMKRNNIQILHSHLLNSDIIATLAGSLGRNIKIISTKHGYSEKILRQVPFVERIADLMPLAKKDIYYTVTKWVVRKAFRNYAVSNAISGMYYDLGLCDYRMPFIHHGLNVDGLDNQRVPNTITIVGRLEEFKGHLYLIKALAEVIKKFPSVMLTIIGEGSFRPKLEALTKELGIGSHINFTGFSADPYQALSTSAIVALPSLFEPFGLVYLEAMAMKTPVVAFDTAAGNEILDKNIAMLAKPADFNSLANCIIELLNDPAKASLLAERAFEKYLQNFTTDIMVRNTASFYKAELDERT